MPLRVLMQDKVVYEGEAAPIPRVGDVVDRDGEALPVESVTWAFRDAGLIEVTLAVGDRPYTY